MSDERHLQGLDHQGLHAHARSESLHAEYHQHPLVLAVAERDRALG